MASQFLKLPVVSGGGGGSVTSFNGRVGVVVSQAGDYSGSLISNTPFGTVAAVNVQAAINELDAEKAANPTGPNNSVVVKDGGGQLASLNGWSVNPSLGLDENLTGEVSTTFSPTIKSLNYNANALENSPANNFTAEYLQVNVDTSDDGFQLGTAGQGVTVRNNNVLHEGLSDTGTVVMLQNSFTLGDGVNPIDVRGISYAYGFGEVRNNVNISGPIQGYGFQPTLNAGATIDNSQYVNAFYDFSNMPVTVPGYTAFSSGPIIGTIPSNKNYAGMNINPTITTFDASAGFIGVGISGILGTFGANSYYNGVSVNPTIASVRYAAGITVGMDNVTVYPGVQAAVTIQDLFIQSILAGSTGNSVTIEYTPGGIAGSEVVSNIGLAIQVQIESGVSTAQNVKDALDLYAFTAANLTTTVTGVASNPQTTQGPTSLAGGIDPGTKQAAFFDGDVQITGDLSFGGALSIGKLSAFAAQAVVDGGGVPSTIHSLVTSPTVAANATIANADTIGVNTAALMDIGANATVTSALVGLTALALPAVVTMGAGSTVDRITGATFALSLDAAAGGGTIANLELCRAVAIPNGATTVTRLVGFKFDLPFGDPGTTSWGVYESPGVHNYLQGDLLIGGTAGSDDTVTNSSVALEVKSATKAFVNARMTTTERDALTAINGMQLYNTTTDKLQVYAAGSWVDLH
jgi:hypothetical protein